MTTDRDRLSREQFVSSVRTQVNDRLTVIPHHPDAEYTPLAFRHYVRRAAVFGALERLVFKTALDVGCAEGFFMQAIRDRFGAEVWGVDISTVAVGKVHADLGMTAGAADATKLPFADGSFDLVYSTEVIEHVLDPDLMLAEMRRVSRGNVLVTTPISANDHEHEPDYELEQEGHVNNFDRATVEHIFGPEASYGSFRCNASFALLKAVGRHLPAPFRDGFYELDHRLARGVGTAEKSFKPLRNRDWLITVPGFGSGDQASPGWRCAACHGELREADDQLVCSICGEAYPVSAGVPDFFRAGPPAPAS